MDVDSIMEGNSVYREDLHVQIVKIRPSVTLMRCGGLGRFLIRVLLGGEMRWPPSMDASLITLFMVEVLLG